MEKTYTSRIQYLDFLRVASMFAIIVLHVSCENWGEVDVISFEWQTFNFFDSISRWGVPVFVMISGALFLRREIPIKKMYCKYIMRLLLSFVFWSVVYAVLRSGGINERLEILKYGYYHMWFILMMIGIYMCVPIIKQIVRNKVALKYYLFLSGIFAFFIPSITTLVSDFGTEKMKNILSVINKNISIMDIQIGLGFATYFILGYYLNENPIGKRVRVAIYILGMIGFVSTVVLNSAVSIAGQTQKQNYYGNFTINVLFESVAVFTWFNQKKWGDKKISSLVQKLSKHEFGAYIIHVLVLEQLNNRLGLNALSFNPALSVICISVIVFVISFASSAILNRIPIVNKYIL